MNLNKVFINTGNGTMEQLLLPPSPHSYSPLINYKPGNLILHNGNIYICKQDNGPSSIEVAPGDNDEYWAAFNIGNTTSINGVWNKQDIVEESGTWTAPKTAWYKLLIIGGGGGGSNATSTSSGVTSSGSGGCSGEYITKYVYCERGQEVQIIVGAGGAGRKNTNTELNGFPGGDTTVTIGETVYTALGGAEGYSSGSSTYRGPNPRGFTGGFQHYNTNSGGISNAVGGTGAGYGGGAPYILFKNGCWYGAGGGGGSISYTANYDLKNGGDGHAGAVIISYFSVDNEM